MQRSLLSTTVCLRCALCLSCFTHVHLFVCLLTESEEEGDVASDTMEFADVDGMSVCLCVQFYVLGVVSIV